MKNSDLLFYCNLYLYCPSYTRGIIVSAPVCAQLLWYILKCTEWQANFAKAGNFQWINTFEAI